MDKNIKVVQLPADKEQFSILLCGRKEMMERVRRLSITIEGVHMKFVSSPSFLMGRALFNQPNLMLIDVDADNLQLRTALSEFTSQFPDVPIFAMASEPDHSFAVELVKMGVSAYFMFPAEYRKVGDQVNMFYNDWVAKRKKEEFVEIQKDTYDFRHVIGDSVVLKEMIERAHKVIKNSTMTVLITGETGTGKELFARAIHYNGKNKNSPFVDIACSALPENLLESELFGYEKGAFTDARERKIGLFELAGDGTIFLDEIGDISMATQSKLLKVIEDRSMRRVGGIRDIPVRARIIAATSADLEAKMRSREFRKDLYHRLKILPLEVPALRERREDIPLLVTHFLKMFNSTYAKRIKGVSHQAMHMLLEHDWEGNVRELKHCIERAVLLEEGDWIDEGDFEFERRKTPQHKRKSTADRAESEGRGEPDALMLLVPISRGTLTQVQRMYVQKVLERLGGNKLKASRLLKISRPRLDRILRNEGGNE